MANNFSCQQPEHWTDVSPPPDLCNQWHDFYLLHAAVLCLHICPIVMRPPTKPTVFFGKRMCWKSCQKCDDWPSLRADTILSRIDHIVSGQTHTNILPHVRSLSLHTLKIKFKFVPEDQELQLEIQTALDSCSECSHNPAYWQPS